MKPSNIRLLEMANNYQYSFIIYTIAKLDIMDFLITKSDNPQTCEEVAKNVNVTNTDWICRILRMAQAIDLVSVDDEDRYRITLTGELLVENSFGSLKEVIVRQNEEIM